MGSAEMRRKAKQFIDEADDHVVKMVYSMLEADRKDDWWDSLPKHLQQEIDQSIAQLDAGEGIPHDEVMKKHKKWFTR